jgi:hypothetical protein
LLLRPASALTQAGMVCSEVKPLTCRVPFAKLSCHALACSASSTCTGSRYDLLESQVFPFHGTLESAGMIFPNLYPCSSQRVFRVLFWLGKVSSAQHIQSRQKYKYRCRVYQVRTGILTSFPFVHWELPVHLGSPYSGLMNVAQKPVCYAAPRIFT